MSTSIRATDALLMDLRSGKANARVRTQTYKSLNVLCPTWLQVKILDLILYHHLNYLITQLLDVHNSSSFTINIWSENPKEKSYKYVENHKHIANLISCSC